MSPQTSLDPARAKAIVEARLGRDPQDMLEASVALEAWGGVPAQRALGAGRSLMEAVTPEPQRSRGTVPEAGREEGFMVEAIAFIVAVIAIACWAAPLGDSLGSSVMERGLMLALPVTLALQWGLRSRYLGRPEGLMQLGLRPRALILVACAIVGIPSALFDLSGTVAGTLALTWTGGTVLLRRRWSIQYALLVIVATAGMYLYPDPLSVLGAMAAVVTILVAVAVRPGTTVPAHPPGRWARAVRAGLIGAGLGAMLVTDPTVSWSVGDLPALALLPSTVASFWGGYHLWQFQQVIPRALAGVSVLDGDRRRLAWAPLRTLFGAIARLVALTAVLSAALYGGAAYLGTEVSGIGVLTGFGLVALATLLVSLLESVGRARFALFAVLCAVLAEEAVRVSGYDPFPGAGLLIGAGVAVLVALPAAIALLSRPASTLATALWIT
jgi:hypothetical protein